MRALLGLIRKEFIQVFRDSNMVRLIFIMPIMQMLIFGYVANTEVKLIALDVYDTDQSVRSRELVRTMAADEYFVPRYPSVPLGKIEDRFKSGQSEMALIITEDFSERLGSGQPAKVGLIADGANSNSASIGMGYAARMAQQYSTRDLHYAPPIDLRPSILYNPEAESVYYMVPGIVATLLLMITVMLTAMAVVREREIGTFEQLMVTPISTRVFLAGKVIPFIVLAFLEMGLALVLGVLWFDVPFVGSKLLLFGLAGIFLLTTLGVGLFFSTLASTQQQAMFFAWFFSVFSILTSGFLTPVENMPQWLQYLTYLNPMRFFMNIVRGIMMKGAGIAELSHDILVLAVFGVVVFGFSVMRFSKRTA
jgi:ABC-2 type transport system permease protein